MDPDPGGGGSSDGRGPADPLARSGHADPGPNADTGLPRGDVDVLGDQLADDAGRPAEITALLGRGTHFEGKLFFDGRVRIDGSFRGEIRGEDVLVIGEGAEIRGRIEVFTCIVTGGVVEADIRARDAIELYAPAKVTGDLHAPAIFIDRGVQFQGNCKMAPLDEESPADASPEASLDDAPTVAGTKADDPAGI